MDSGGRLEENGGVHEERGRIEIVTYTIELTASLMTRGSVFPRRQRSSEFPDRLFRPWGVYIELRPQVGLSEWIIALVIL